MVTLPRFFPSSLGWARESQGHEAMLQIVIHTNNGKVQWTSEFHLAEKHVSLTFPGICGRLRKVSSSWQTLTLDVCRSCVRFPYWLRYSWRWWRQDWSIARSGRVALHSRSRGSCVRQRALVSCCSQMRRCAWQLRLESRTAKQDRKA